MDLKKEVKEFWNSNPVDGLSEDVRLRIEYRKRKDRWMNDNILPLEYKGSMLSVGCGQGTDIMSALQKIDTNDILIGLDISLDSIRSALKGIKELSDEDSHIYFINGDADRFIELTRIKSGCPKLGNVVAFRIENDDALVSGIGNENTSL